MGASMAIRIDDSLASQRKLTRVMFFFRGGGKKKHEVFFPAKKPYRR
jgi:hypothetical protein